MAIRLTSSTLSTPFEYISSQDGALDVNSKGFKEKWQQYRDGTITEPPLLEGEEPTRWELTPITNSRQRSYLQGYHEKHGASALFVAYAASGITGVNGLLDEHGEPVELQFVREDKYSIVSEQQIATIPAEVLVEIGTVLLTHDAPKKS